MCLAEAYQRCLGTFHCSFSELAPETHWFESRLLCDILAFKNPSEDLFYIPLSKCAHMPTETPSQPTLLKWSMWTRAIQVARRRG